MSNPSGLSSSSSTSNPGPVVASEPSRRPSATRHGRRQGIFWLLTIPYAGNTDPSWTKLLPDGITWIRGQREIGGSTGYEHWQVMVAFSSKKSLSGVKTVFGTECHAELSRSESAAEYVWKDESAVPDTRFEHGHRPFRRNSRTDWDSVWTMAQSGRIDDVSSEIRVVHYRTLRQIASDYVKPVGLLRTCYVFWGRTGTGKSRRAWDEAGMDAYSKDPRTKFWCGYQMELHVVIDEFRGGIDIAHLLRWLDRYPVRVEVKGSSRPLVAEKIWITSNLEPKYWYPDCDEETKSALMRRLIITEFE